MTGILALVNGIVMVMTWRTAGKYAAWSFPWIISLALSAANGAAIANLFF